MSVIAFWGTCTDAHPLQSVAHVDRSRDGLQSAAQHQRTDAAGRPSLAQSGASNAAEQLNVNYEEEM
jgi:hypothetical protein